MSDRTQAALSVVALVAVTVGWWDFFSVVALVVQTAGKTAER